MSWRVLFVVVALLAVFSAPAIADVGPVDPPMDRVQATVRVAESLRIAEEFWDAAPDCRVRVFEATPAEMIAFVGIAAAAATFIGPRDGECPIWISSTFAPPTIRNRIEACSALVHELGHDLGWAHDDDPLSVMNPVADVTVWGCYERFIGHGGRAWRDTHPDVLWATRPKP